MPYRITGSDGKHPSVKFRCESCHANLSAPLEEAGTAMPCPQCKANLRVPGEQEHAAWMRSLKQRKKGEAKALVERQGRRESTKQAREAKQQSWEEKRKVQEAIWRAGAQQQAEHRVASDAEQARLQADRAAQTLHLARFLVNLYLAVMAIAIIGIIIAAVALSDEMTGGQFALYVTAVALIALATVVNWIMMRVAILLGYLLVEMLQRMPIHESTQDEPTLDADE